MDEQGERHIVYGIKAVTSKGKIITQTADLFFNYAEARKFTAICNKKNLSLLHLNDVAEDILTQKYAV